MNVRELRRQLRRLEQLLGIQADGCCQSLVSLSQCHTLLEIEERGETTTRDLAQILQLDKSTMSRTIDNLVKNELVERRTDNSDRRYTLLSLTAQGRKTCSSINSGADEFFTSVINNLAEENPPALTASLDNLIQAMNATVKTKGGQSCCD